MARRPVTLEQREQIQRDVHLGNAIDPGPPLNPLNGAAAAAARMRERTEEVNNLLRDAAERLEGLGLGVSAHVQIDEGYGYETLLHFGKSGKEWRLTILSGPPGTDGDYVSTDALSAPREDRINAVKALPTLFAKLVEVANQQAEDLKETVAGGRAFLAMLEGKKQ
jgi:hypothetical protein